MAHELGHSLGMSHDIFDDNSVRKDSKGRNCTGIMRGVMSQWSACSVEDFTQHYSDVMNRVGSFCMPPIPEQYRKFFLNTHLSYPLNDIVKIQL